MTRPTRKSGFRRLPTLCSRKMSRGSPDRTFPLSHLIASGEKPKLRGEVLRSKWWPSVSGLLLERANVMAKKAQGLDQAQGVDAIRKGCKFVNALVEWEGASAAIVP